MQDSANLAAAYACNGSKSKPDISHENPAMSNLSLIILQLASEVIVQLQSQFLQVRSHPTAREITETSTSNTQICRTFLKRLSSPDSLQVPFTAIRYQKFGKHLPWKELQNLHLLLPATKNQRLV
jgi:hypothetical protein